MDNKENLQSILREIVTETPQDFDFPCGEPNPIPLDFESRVASFVAAMGPDLSAADISSLRTSMTYWEAYNFIIVALRLAVLSTRTRSVAFLDSSIIILLMTNSLVDWRDTLRGLAVLDDCCTSLNVSLRDKMDQFTHLMNGELKRIIYEGFLKREKVMQSLTVMGIARKQAPDGITYVSDA